MTERQRLPRWSVRSRILASILAVTALGMLVAGGTAYLVARDRALADVDTRLETRVNAARFVVTGEGAADVSAPAPPGYATAAEALEAVLARVIPGTNESSVGIVDGRAQFIPGVALPFTLDSDRAFLDRVVGEATDDRPRIGTMLGPSGALRYVSVPIVLEGSGQQALYVTAIDLDAELDQVNAAFALFTVVALVSLVVIGLVGWFVAGRLLRPIRQLRAAASRITATDRKERIPVEGRDDVSELTRTVNDMLDRLDDALESQRQLLDDVRHELRTPLTIVRGHLELLDPADPRDVEQTRAIAIDELDRMSGLVDGIESLAVSERELLDLAPLDVGELTRSVHAKAAVLPGHAWELGPVASGTLQADGEKLTQAWLQLVDNAAKYAAEGTPVELGSYVSGPEVVLYVSDRGAGVPVEAQGRIFERFGRVEQSRGVRGSGLGLSIVRAIAEGHGGRVGLESSPRGSTFSIVLPLGLST